MELNPDYSEWPRDLQDRNAMAREIWGRDLVRAYDSWMRITEEMLSKGPQQKRSTPELKRVEEWIAQLGPEDRQTASYFVQYISRNVVFSLLNALDGTSAGSWITPAITKYRLVLEVYEDIDACVRQQVLESFDLGADDIDFHDQWVIWLQRYGQFAVSRIT
jgi:hypothetical protein